MNGQSAVRCLVDEIEAIRDTTADSELTVFVCGRLTRAAYNTVREAIGLEEEKS